jgi:hypothetical protein
MERQLEPKSVMAPLIVGVDVARFGTDKTVFCLRRGRLVYRFDVFEHLDVVQVAHRVAAVITDDQPDKVCIDVGGVGAGVYDVLATEGMAAKVLAVNFGERADNPERYLNRRAEMWVRMNEWLKAALPVSLPKIDGLAEDLCAPLLMFDAVGRIQLEAKADIKKRLGHSPDLADALALTFALKNTAFLRAEKMSFVDDNVYL